MPKETFFDKKKLEKLLDRIEKIEEENKLLKKIILSAQPLKCVYKEGFPTWNRHYHTEEKFLKQHKEMGFTLEENSNIGYLLKINPNNIFKEK